MICHLQQPCVHPVKACDYRQSYWEQAVAWSTRWQSHTAMLRVMPFGPVLCLRVWPSAWVRSEMRGLPEVSFSCASTVCWAHKRTLELWELCVRRVH